MMVAWSFPVKSFDDLARLLRSLGKHRYVEKVDHRIHWMVDEALRDHPLFAAHASARALRPTIPFSTSTVHPSLEARHERLHSE